MGMFDSIKNGAVDLATALGLYQPVQVTPSAPPRPAPVPPPSAKSSWADRYNYQKSQYEASPNDFIVGYRLNNKKGSLESLPTFFDKKMVDPYIDAYKASKERYNNVELHPDDLASILLQEGRYDFGFNEFNYDTAPKKAKKIYDKMKDEGFTHRQAGFAALINEKHDVAKRTGMPFARAWNGAGKSTAGQTGTEYANKVQKTKEILQHEKNKNIRDYFYKKLTPQQRAELDSFDYNDPFGDSIG